MDLLDDCIQKFHSARFSIAEAMASLYLVKKNESWEGKFSSWQEFCEDGLKYSRSLCDQYCANYEHYILKGSLTVNDLVKADMAKLYKARHLKGTPVEHYALVLTHGRGELRDALNDETGHQHEPETITWCKGCHKRIYS